MSSMARKLMRWTGKALLWLVVALLVLAASGAIYQAVATERAAAVHEGAHGDARRATGGLLASRQRHRRGGTGSPGGLTLIHPPSGKAFSRNFAQTAFSEVGSW